MYFSENYLHFVKDISKHNMDDYDVISVEDLALNPRKASFSDCSSNGILSHDSGHDSYLEDGTGYSGDDEESVQCDICSFSKEINNRRKNDGYNHKTGRKRRSRRKRNKRTHGRIENEEKPAIKLRELPKNDNFEFEGEKKVEFKWTLQCYIDSLLVPRLRSVVIDRGRPEDLGDDNILVFDESSEYSQIQKWRQNVFTSLNERNSREINDFNMLPSYMSCDSCSEQRQRQVKMAIDEGKDLKLSESGQPVRIPDSMLGEDRKIEPKWRMRILNELKINNSIAIANMRTMKRQAGMYTQRKVPKCSKKDFLSIVKEEGWEIYDVNSDGEIAKCFA